MASDDRLHDALATYAQTSTRGNARNALRALDWRRAPAPDSTPPNEQLAEAIREWKESRNRASAVAVFDALDWTASTDEQSVRHAAELLQNAAAWSSGLPADPVGALDGEAGAEPGLAPDQGGADAPGADGRTAAQQIGALVSALVRNVEQARADWERSEEDSRTKQALLDRLEAELAEVRLSRVQSAEDSRAKEERIEQLDRELIRARRDWENSEGDSRAKKLKIEQLDRELSETRSRYERSEEDSRQKREQIERLEQDLNSVFTMYEQSEEDSRQKQQQIGQLEQDLGQVSAMYEQSEADSRQKREQIEQLEQDLNRVASEREAAGGPASEAEEDLMRHLAEMTLRWRQSEDDSEAKRRQVEQIESHLKQARADWEQSEQDSRAKQEQIEKLELDLEKIETDWLKSEEDSEAKRDEIQRKNLQNAALSQHIQRLEAQVETLRSYSETHWSKVHEPASFSELIGHARRHLNALVIPDSAPRDIHVLDSQPDHGAWAHDAWRALCALQEYAERKQDAAQEDNFAAWCLKGDAVHQWHLERVALSESEGTMARYGDKRVFAVDQRIDESGEIEMQAHLKVRTKGNKNIPRIYFHDDSRGRTRRIHIGLIGPHYLAPTPDF